MYNIERAAIAVATSHDRSHKKRNPARKPTLIVINTKEINPAVINAIIRANLISFFDRRHLIIVNVQKNMIDGDISS